MRFRVSGFGFIVEGLWFRVKRFGLGFWPQGFEFRVEVKGYLGLLFIQRVECAPVRQLQRIRKHL